MAEMIVAVAKVHELGYIHRDLKPDNVLLDWQGHLKLTDLGLSKKVMELSNRFGVVATLCEAVWSSTVGGKDNRCSPFGRKLPRSRHAFRS